MLYFSKIFTESEAEESGDEGVDGPDEEPPVGHQCHAYNAQMTREEKKKPSLSPSSLPLFTCVPLSIQSLLVGQLRTADGSGSLLLLCCV